MRKPKTVNYETAPEMIADLATATAHQSAARTGQRWCVYRRTEVFDYRREAAESGILGCTVLYFIKPASDPAPNESRLILEVVPDGPQTEG